MVGNLYQDAHRSQLQETFELLILNSRASSNKSRFPKDGMKALRVHEEQTKCFIFSKLKTFHVSQALPC